MSMFEIHGGFTGLAASSRVRLARPNSSTVKLLTRYSLH